MHISTISAKILGSLWAIDARAIAAHASQVREILSGKQFNADEIAYLRELRDAKSKITFLAGKKRKNKNMVELPMGEYDELADIEDLNDDDEDSEPVYAIMPIRGIINKDGMDCEKGTAAMAADLQKLGGNPNVRGVILRIDSGGGTVAGTQHFADVIYNFKANFGKPVVAVLEDSAMSAAYWLASGADHILVANDTTEVGSIGVVTTFMNDMRMWEEMGVDITNVYATKSFNKSKWYQDALEGDFAQLRAELDKVNEVFISQVRRGRRGKVRTANTEQGTPQVFTGKTYMGQEAIEIGLADAMGGIQEAIKWIDKDIRQSNAANAANAGAESAGTNQNDMAGVAEVAQQEQPDPLSYGKDSNNHNNNNSKKPNMKGFFLKVLAAIGLSTAKTASGEELTADAIADKMAALPEVDDQFIAEQATKAAEAAVQKAFEAQNAEMQKTILQAIADMQAATEKAKQQAEAQALQIQQLADEIAKGKGGRIAAQKPVDGSTEDGLDILSKNSEAQFWKQAFEKGSITKEQYEANLASIAKRYGKA